MPGSVIASKADQALAASTAGTVLVSTGPTTNPSTPAALTYDSGTSTLAVPSISATTGLTTLGTATTGSLASNRYVCGTPRVDANWAIPQFLFWGFEGEAPFAIGVSGPNPYNGQNDDVLAIGFNSSNLGSKLVQGVPNLYLAWESHVYDDADPSGFVTGPTHNFEFDFNQETSLIGQGTRTLQFRSRRDDVDPVSGFTCWRWVINGQFGIFDVHSRTGDLLFSVDTPGNLIGRNSLSLGQPVTGIPGEGDLSMGGHFALGGGGSVGWGLVGFGDVVTYSGATGTTTFSQAQDTVPAIRVKPFTNGSVFTTSPGIVVTKADGSTMAAGLGQSGVQVGGSIKFIGGGALSGFGGAEVASLAGVGLVQASPIHIWRAGNATTDWMQLDGTLTLHVPLTLDDAKNVDIGAVTGTKWGTAANRKQAWWGATPVVQPAKIANATADVNSLATTVNAILAQLQSLGLQAAA